MAAGDGFVRRAGTNRMALKSDLSRDSIWTLEGRRRSQRAFDDGQEDNPVDLLCVPKNMSGAYRFRCPARYGLRYVQMRYD